MSGQGKYTTYAPAATSKNALLNKLFKGNSATSNPLADLTGKEEDARAQTVALAKTLLSPDVQQGDPGFFPNGVNMDYVGDPNGVTTPDLTKVAWTSAGGPANAYMPDISSPGPGKTDPLTKDADPKLAVVDVKGAGYVPGAPDTGTKSPSVTSTVVKANSELGKQGPQGYDVNG